MKQILISLLFILILAFNSIAQVRENNLQMSLGVQNGLSITIPDADEDLIDKVWKKYTKAYGKLARNKKAKEEYIEKAVIQSINGSNAMDIYVTTEDNSITAFFDLKNGFLNSANYPKEYKGASEFMQEFSYEVQREKTRMELEEEQDKLKKLNKKMADLLSDNKGYHKDIDEANARIKKAEANIIANEKNQDLTKSEIANQTKAVEAVQQKLSKIGK